MSHKATLMGPGIYPRPVLNWSPLGTGEVSDEDLLSLFKELETGEKAEVDQLSYRSGMTIRRQNLERRSRKNFEGENLDAKILAAKTKAAAIQYVLLKQACKCAVLNEEIGRWEMMLGNGCVDVTELMDGADCHDSGFSIQKIDPRKLRQESELNETDQDLARLIRGKPGIQGKELAEKSHQSMENVRKRLGHGMPLHDLGFRQKRHSKGYFPPQL